ncbi:ATPase, T2SS/T4P/T4SS family [uncultured Desulfuromusa sp.]|uniref:GspE/PulE family protein n=1 Tax=uncultured Desulfuromusa sp. TaxID=219183 RepID=UPI002AA8A9FF|nr:ATPase, T2SS/T4P/T4SS family [uncultured Desulfuromusa sp.]
MSDNLMGKEMTYQRQPIGRILADMGAIAPAEIDLVLEQQQQTGKRFGTVGVEAGLFTEAELAKALATQFQYDYIDLSDTILNAELIATLPSDIPIKHHLIPLERNDTTLTIAIADPTDVTALDQLELQLGLALELKIAAKGQIERLIERGAGSQRVLREASEDFKLQLIKETDKGDEVLSIDKLTADTSPIIRLIDSTLFDALKKRASDIHIEATVDGVVIKYRVDGVLFQATETIDSRFQSPIISRIKVMSELDISERRIPQDGRFKVRLGDKSIDFRVSIMPTSFGEDAVIRILDKESIAADMHGLSFEALGFSAREMQRMRSRIREPYGMVLVTGPTGSGKTTTLYAALSEINSIEEKIVTIEDPVEYQVKGVVQVPVNEKKGLTFARGLRSILRHDPDKIMVGEIRDPETAQIAVQSALTGHLVFTTVHANNVFDVLGRFLHMGIDAYNFVSCLNCVLAQRLVRNLCRHCKRPVVHPPELLHSYGLTTEQGAAANFHDAPGCKECNGLGYSGRSAIVELLEMNDVMREMIAGKAPVSELKKQAHADGTIFLRQAALEKVLRGETTFREIDRVTFAEG